MASTKKNLIKSRDEYTRYYGDFRGVDFSSDHTQVHPQRLAYLVNMYKDYRSGEGNSLETIPGFRSFFEAPTSAVDGKTHYPTIYGLHEFNYIYEGVNKKVMLVHADDKLYSVTEDGYYKGIAAGLNKTASVSFHFNNRLYIIDGVSYRSVRHEIDGNDNSTFIASLDANFESPSSYMHVPTIYANIDVSDTSDISKYQYEQINLLADTFKQTYIGDGSTEKYYLYHSGEVESVKVDGKILSQGTPEGDKKDYTVSGSCITFTSVPKKSEGVANVEVKVALTNDEWSANVQRIIGCTIATVFDKRVFLSGNPLYPNHIFFCGINRETGLEDPTYFGELDFVRDGVEPAPITALIPVADTLAALKNHTKQDGSVYFHSRFETSANYAPVTYPATQGLSGVGCLGAALNFRDDPVFISQYGVEGIGQLSVRLERAIEHRSSLIDAKLCNLDLSRAKLCEWGGYLIVLCDGGKMFLGDSRQTYTHDSGVMQYEWYYCEDIGIYTDAAPEYYFSANIPDSDSLQAVTIDGVEYPLCVAKDIYDLLRMVNTDLVNSPVPASFAKVAIDNTYSAVLHYSLEGDEMKTKAYLIEHRGSYTGGEFHPATSIATIGDNLYFGTDNGVVCAFNFDQRGADGLIPSGWYSFDNRTIYSGCATKMDNCDIPHLAKSTIKKSTVIKTKALLSAAIKVKVRTDRKQYSKVTPDESVGRYSTRILDFSDISFGDWDFTTTEQTVHAAKEQEKHWVEKQYLLYTDEYQKPLSLQYIAYRYKVAGRVKG